MDVTDIKFIIFTTIIFIGIIVSLYFIFNNETMHKILSILLAIGLVFLVYIILSLLFSSRILVLDMNFIILIAIFFIGMFISLYFAYNNTKNKLKIILFVLFLVLGIAGMVVGLLFAIPILFILGLVLFALCIVELFSDKLDNLFVTPDQNKIKIVLFFLLLILGAAFIFIGKQMGNIILFSIGILLLGLSIFELFSDSLDTFFTDNLTKITLFIVFFVLGIMAMITGYFLRIDPLNIIQGKFGIASYVISMLLFGLCIFELISDGIDTFVTDNGPQGNVKLIICSVLLLLGLASILASNFFGTQFAALGVILLVMCIFETFSDQLNSTNSKGIVCVVSALLCISAILGMIKYPDKIQILLIISFLAFCSFILSLFDVPGFGSPTYVFLLFLLANIPVVYAVIDRLGYKGADQMYIPLLIAFYVLSMVILYMMGSTDLADKNSMFVIFGIISVCLLFYMKSLPLSLSKTFFTLFGMILLFMVALHYMVNSSIWYVYLIMYALVLFYMLKTTPLNILETIKKYLPQPKKKEMIFLAAELSAVLLYLYTRPVIQKIYVHDGKLLVNHPLHLQNETHIKVTKHFKYTYSLSFWVYINQNNPSSSPKATDFIPFLSYGNKPVFTYNSLRNMIRVEMKTENKMVIVDDITHVKLQKWNHIVMNQDNDTIDIFINGELHKSTSHVVPSKDAAELYVGTQHGIDGTLCNVMFFKKMLTTKKIKNLYNDFHDKNPPTF